LLLGNIEQELNLKTNNINYYADARTV